MGGMSIIRCSPPEDPGLGRAEAVGVVVEQAGHDGQQQQGYSPARGSSRMGISVIQGLGLMGRVEADPASGSASGSGCAVDKRSAYLRIPFSL